MVVDGTSVPKRRQLLDVAFYISKSNPQPVGQEDGCWVSRSDADRGDCSMWQPAIVYPLITLGLAALQASSKRQRLRNVGLALCGIALPVILTTFWFASKGALGEFIDGWITFNFVHLDRHGATIPENLSKMLGALHFGYTHAVVPICLGFLAILLFSITTFSAYRGNYRLWIQEERSVALVVSFPFAVPLVSLGLSVVSGLLPLSALRSTRFRMAAVGSNLWSRRALCHHGVASGRFLRLGRVNDGLRCQRSLLSIPEYRFDTSTTLGSRTEFRNA